MAVAGVILSIGSKYGPGGLASLQAGIQMLGQLAGALKGSMDAAWKFGDIMRELDVDISVADKATKGLIDTTELARGAMKFSAAQMKISAAQLRDVAVAAEDMSGKLGTDATDEFNKLTDAITKGQGRALKQYGLQLEETTDLVDAQAEALQKITALGSGLTTEYEHLGDRLYALDNALGTLKNTALSSLDSWDWLNNKIEDLAKGADNLTASIGEVGVTGTLGHALDVVNTGFASWSISLVQNLGLVSEEVAMMAQLRNQMTLLAKEEDRYMSGKSWGDVFGGIGTEETLPTDVFGLASDKAPKGGKKGGGGGGGGGKRAKAAPDLASMTGEQRLAVFAKEIEAQRTLAGIEAERAAFVEVYSAVFAGIAETSAAYTVSEVEVWEQERAAEEREMAYLERRSAYMAQYGEAEEVAWERERLMEEERAAAEERKLIYLDQYREAHQSTFEDLMFGEADYKAQSEAMWKQSMTTKLQMVSLMIGGWSGLMDKENKKQFKAWQALAVVEATIAGLVGSIETYKALCGVGPAGPIIGAIAAAGVLVQTAVTVAKIKNTKYKGGASNVGGTGGFDAAASAGSAGAGGPPAAPADSGKIEITMNVNLDGEQVFKSVQTHNSDAVRAGRTGTFQMAG